MMVDSRATTGFPAAKASCTGLDTARMLRLMPDRGRFRLRIVHGSNSLRDNPSISSTEDEQGQPNLRAIPQISQNQVRTIQRIK